MFSRYLGLLIRKSLSIRGISRGLRLMRLLMPQIAKCWGVLCPGTIALTTPSIARQVFNCATNAPSLWPNKGMIAQGAGAIANIILDPVFIFGFNTGLEGAAYATIIGQALSMLLSFGYLCKSKTFHLKPLSFLHDFRLDIVAEILAGLEGSLDDGGSLHPVDFRIGNAETNSAEAHHRVGLMELINPITNLLFIDAESLRDLSNLGILVDVRKELVERRIE